MTIRAVITDIEGTTSSIDFVHQVLFPYSAQALPDFVRNSAAMLQSVLGTVQQHPEFAASPGSSVAEQAINLWLRWIQEDRKETTLKTVQGMIWKQGYVAGVYRAHVYPDVLPALQAWRAQGLLLAVYSSGSIAAQKLFFQHSELGDLTSFFADYFDTTSGGKREAESYRCIARGMGFLPGELLFLSDIREELDAAAAAGYRVIGLQRDDRKPLETTHPIVRTFSEIHP